MKYLIAGLGNIGDEYAQTRHNIGFVILDALARASNISFTDKRYGSVSELRFKGRTLILLKPSTFMNLSGNAVRYWLQKHDITEKNLLVIVDDIALPFGKIRIRPDGSDGGHNGLTSIIETLGTKDFARMRIGIGSGFGRGQQVDYVLGEWSDEEKKQMVPISDKAGEAIKSFVTAGLERTMTAYNTKN